MNLIFNKIIQKIKNCTLIKTEKEREQFEEEIEKLLEESYNEYDNYSKNYLEFNQELLKLDKYNMKSLMLENNDVKVYDKENYPFYRYFLMTIYPSKKNYIDELKKTEDKYPLLTAYLNISDDSKELFNNFYEFNEFCNFMINYYSYRISRKEASTKLIKDENIYINNIYGFRDKFNKFKEIWKKLKFYSIKYGCRDEMPVIDLDENKSLAFFLNDIGEIGKGMYIASAYQNFIDWHNNFLNILIKSKKYNLKNEYKEIQKVKKNEILYFDSEQKILEIIFENYKRNIFMKDKTINYNNYKSTIYDFDSIEHYLETTLLTNKVLYNENLEFVTYCYEGFRGNNSDIIVNFINMYSYQELNLEKNQKIYNYIKIILHNEIKTILNIYFSLQFIIKYLSKNKKNEKDDLNTILLEIPHFYNISTKCLFFMNDVGIKVEELYEVFLYFEFLSFKPIVDNLLFYKLKIDENISKNIHILFKQKKFIIITKNSLASACRKLISRYLVGHRCDLDIDEKNKLYLYLYREEFWPKNLWKNEEKIEEDLKVLDKENLVVGQCFELYKLLGGD